MSSASAASRRYVERVLGTVVSVDVRGGVPADDAMTAAMLSLHAADATFSPFRADSAIARIDRGELRPADAHADVRRVLARCEELHRRTHGAFDIRATGRLDPSAFVKGWAVERAAAILVAHGVRDFTLSAGDDVLTRGGPTPGRRWRIGIQHPEDRGQVAATVVAGDLAIATSGASERGRRGRDPRTARAPAGVLSVTVSGPDLALADAYSTAAWAMGPDGPDWTLTLDGYEAMTILGHGEVVCTPGFPDLDPRG